MDGDERLRLDYKFSVFLISTALLAIAFALALLAYIDAPVTDVVLVLIIVAALAALVTTLAAALSYQHARSGDDGGAARSRCLALFALLAALLAATVACGLTLELKRFDSDDSQQADATSLAT